MLVCTNNHPNRPGVRFCTTCGQPVFPPVPAPAAVGVPPRPPSSTILGAIGSWSRRTRIAVGTTAVVVVAAIVAGGFAIFGSGSSMSGFAGQWEGHGRDLTIHADGSFTLSMRTYTWCTDGPPPCDSQTSDTITDGDQASGTLATVTGNVATGTVSSTTDTADTPAGAITMTLNPATDTLAIRGLTFCGPKAPVGTCGA